MLTISFWPPFLSVRTNHLSDPHFGFILERHFSNRRSQEDSQEVLHSLVHANFELIVNHSLLSFPLPHFCHMPIKKVGIEQIRRWYMFKVITELLRRKEVILRCYQKIHTPPS